jgi:O-antigen/teichoic acid export membrane protein
MLLTLGCVVLAGPVATFYGYDALAVLLPVAGFSLLFDGLASASLMTMERHLQMGRLVMLNLATQVVSIAVMVGWAWISPSVWALVAGTLAASLFRLAISYAVFGRERPHLAWDRASLLAIVAFGSWIVLNTPLGFVAEQADRFTLGKLVPLAVLGVYQIAATLTGLPYNVLSRVGGSILFPTFSRARDGGLDTRRVYHQARLPIEISGGLLIAGLIACGPVLIQLLWDERWHEAGWMVLPLAISQWFRIISLPGASALFAEGQPYWMVIANTARILGYFVFVPLGWLSADMGGALVGFAAGESLGFVVYVEGMRRHGVRTMLASLGTCALLAISAGAGSFVRIGVLDSGAPPLLAFFAAGLVASAFWVLPVASQRKLLSKSR